MKKDSVVEFCKPEGMRDAFTAQIREGAQRLIAQAVQAEFDEFLADFAGQTEEWGRSAVVRNGFLPERPILTGIGPIPVRMPKARSRTEARAVFRSARVPAYVRRVHSVDAALPWLYLKGVSTGDMSEALSVLVGPEAAGLSASVVSRLKSRWQKEYEAWCRTSLGSERWVYLWADGIYSGLRAEDERLCALVVIGVNERGQKRFLAIEDGVRGSKQSWRELLLGLKKRGLTLAPRLAVGDGALGFWAALEEIYPETRQQRCWVHKIANVLNYLPQAVQPKAKQPLAQIWMAEANTAFEQFTHTYRAKYPKAVQCLAKDREALLAFFDFPAEHWIHIRSTNVIESSFATIRHRTDRTKACLTRDGMLAMMFRLAMAAEQHWKKLRGFEWLAKVIRGVKFRDGVQLRSGKRTSPPQEGSRVAP
jgi:putative transposase